MPAKNYEPDAAGHHVAWLKIIIHSSNNFSSHHSPALLPSRCCCFPWALVFPSPPPHETRSVVKAKGAFSPQSRLTSLSLSPIRSDKFKHNTSTLCHSSACTSSHHPKSWYMCVLFCFVLFAPIFKLQAHHPLLIINKYTSIYQELPLSATGNQGQKETNSFLKLIWKVLGSATLTPINLPKLVRSYWELCSLHTEANSDWSCAISIYLFIILRTHRSIWKCTRGTGQIESSAFIFYTNWSYSCYNKLWDFFPPIPSLTFFLKSLS